MAAVVIKELCIGCGVCSQMCPMQAISVRVKTAHVDTGRCNDCEECVFACPNGAITL
ncbi:4Fe-4S binding protein [Desulfallas sp. Bu1-1]|jgi:Fe-S-cluster-containing hydrogenase component 2|uniref:4Fe-4S binding protein n=1 Tax=Desulfallas sp. Bu1-1 TaxID=2787620 RepID=UPI00189C6036|nr:4Fe-4S binding protein [Desulfallas sp. Bu1-1]MBF7082153.1 4Fe-4S binding protein [Desulfallas sp. Bu1-1]